MQPDASTGPGDRAEARILRNNHLERDNATGGGLGSPGTNLEYVWFAPGTDPKLKKRIVRTVIREVVADLDDNTSEIVFLVHSAGGPIQKSACQSASEDSAMLHHLILLKRIASDEVIADILNRNGLAAENGNHWTKERITALRSYRKIPVFKVEPIISIIGSTSPTQPSL